MKSPKSAIILASAVCLTVILAAIPAGAAVLVSYEFTGASAAQTSGLATGSNVTFGAFTGGGSSPGFSGSSESIFIRYSATAGTDNNLAEALANNAYATFTVTNSTADVYDLDALSFDFFWEPGGNGSERGAMYVMSDRSAYADGNELLSFAKEATDATTSNVLADLSSLSSLGAGSSIEFRLYFSDNANNTSPIFRVDNVTVNGTVVPEPSSALLGGLGALLLLRRRRQTSSSVIRSWRRGCRAITTCG
ncbi:MAG: PEP-CTERM sorting domain-containing protein [Luteolibacter sp.]